MELRTLSELSSTEGKKFFLAVGFSKPHMPWPVPRRYISQWGNGTAFRRFYGSQEEPNFWEEESFKMTKRRNKELLKWNWATKHYSPSGFRRAYYATISFVDAQIGRILGTLEASPARNDTVVILWADHGFHLGEYGLWGKKTLLEGSSRVPFIVMPPQKYLLETPETKVGAHVLSPTDSVDILPTVVDVAGIWPEGKRLRDFIPGSAGTTLRPLLSNPDGYVRPFAVSQYQSHLNTGKQSNANLFGYSLRSRNYRFVVYARRDESGALLARPLDDRMQLYFYAKPGDLERHNVISSPQHLHAREAFLRMWREHNSRNWVGLIGEEPFDHIPATEAPTTGPTTAAPTMDPTAAPTIAPTSAPTLEPSIAPTSTPTPRKPCLDIVKGLRWIVTKRARCNAVEYCRWFRYRCRHKEL